MKTIFIVLLLAALGAGAYFYFSQKQKSSADPKELIAGKWKIDSVNLSHTRDSSLALAFIVSDSNLHKYQFEIDKGLIIQSLNGKTEDTSHYEFAGDRQLLVWSKNDSAKTKWTINKLDSLNMVVQDKDSTVFSFKKI
jgi:hypothetical protein